MQNTTRIYFKLNTFKLISNFKFKISNLKYKPQNILQVRQISKKEGGAGFSLIELIVVLAILLIIIGVTVDIFISMVWHQKRILEEQELLNQTSYVMEYMSKQLRTAVKATNISCLSTTGYVYELTQCPPDPSQPCNGVKFINSLDNNYCTEFFLDTTTDPANPTLKETKSIFPSQSLLSNKFKINYSRFILDGNKNLQFTSDTDSVQPRITILLDVQTRTAGNQQKKIIQTTVSQRNLIR